MPVMPAQMQQGNLMSSPLARAMSAYYSGGASLLGNNGPKTKSQALADQAAEPSLGGALQQPGMVDPFPAQMMASDIGPMARYGQRIGIGRVG